MLTLAFALSSAQAAPASYSICSYGKSWESYTDACGCVGASSGSAEWWGGAQVNIDDGAKPDQRPLGTCFDKSTAMSSVSGSSYYASIEKTVWTRGDKIADNNDAMWLASSSTESIILHEEMETISGGGDPGTDLFPIPLDPFTWILHDGYGHTVADIFVDPGSQILFANFVDVNDDGFDEVVVVFTNGDIWEASGPFGPGTIITPPEGN